jgi:hypothetical protein
MTDALFLHPDRLNRSLGETVFRAVLIAAFPVFLVLSFHYGATVDEMLAHLYGERIYSYYASGFRDQAAKDFYNLHFYGGFFELLCVVCVKISSWLGMNRFFEDYYEIRHVVNAAFGWLTVVFTGLLARRLHGAWSGVLAVLLLLLTPRFLGHAFNNPKDIPFAALFLGGMYFLSLMRRTYPFMTAQAMAGLTVCVGLSMAIRIGGILLVCYAGLLLAVMAFLDRGNMNRWKLARAGGVFLLCSTAAFLINAVFSPWQLESPFLRPFVALREMSRLVGYPDAVIFEGRSWDYMNLPRRFLPIWLYISTPVAVMAGLAFSFVLSRCGRFQVFKGLLFFSVLFPVAYVLVKHPPLYHDMRHFFFIIGPAVVLASGGFTLAYRVVRDRAATSRGRKFAVLACGAVLVVLCWNPASFILRAHPYEAVYFNQIAGGYPGAFFSYELDYWMNARKQANKWVRTMGAINGRTQDDYEFINMNMAEEGRRKALQDRSVVHGLFVDGYPVMMIRPKPGK